MPFLTVWFAIVLLLASVVFFVLLVEKLTMLQISRVLAYAGDHGRAVIERDYAPLGDGGPRRGVAAGELPAERQVVLHRGGPAAIQKIDVPGLVALAEREGAVIAMAWAVGDTVIDGMPLLRVHGEGRPDRRATGCVGSSGSGRSARSSRTPSTRSASSSTSRSRRSRRPSTTPRPPCRPSTRWKTSCSASAG